jgi:hypothetical protein
MGFVMARGAYLRDGWNILDFIIVISAYVSIIFSSGVELNLLRIFRVLRPLRTISGIEGLRVLVTSLIAAMPLLANTIIILLFFFLIFAIGGLQLWLGILKNRCVDVMTGFVHGEDQLCGGSRQCSSGQICVKYVSNPFYGVVNFDDIFSSLLVIFQCVTLEGWSEIMIMLQKAFNFFSFLFFIPLVFIGAFFLLNLTLAVIKSRVKLFYCFLSYFFRFLQLLRRKRKKSMF